MVNMYTIQRNEDYFPDPESFIPERFVNDEVVDEVANSQGSAAASQNKLAEAWMPFYGGGHLCIGMNIALLEMKAVLAYLFKNYEMKIADGAHPEVGSVFTLGVVPGLPLVFKRRAGVKI